MQYKHVYMVWVSLSFLTEGGHFTLVPAILKKLYGDEGSRIFGWAFSFIGIASLIKIFTLKLFLKSLGFDCFLIIYGVLCCLSFLILVFYFKEEKVDVDLILNSSDNNSHF